MMSEALGKRCREPEALLDSSDAGEPKRFHCEETDRFLQLLQLDKTLSDDDDEEGAPSEELLNGIMRNLEEEIAATCSTSYHSSNSGDNSVATDISSRHEGETPDSDSGDDLCYLLEASDDELGIPRSPVLDLKQEICQSPKKTSDGLSDITDLKSLCENWHFEDDLEFYQQLAVYEDAWDASLMEDYINRDFLSQGMLFCTGDSFTAWKLETADAM